MRMIRQPCFLSRLGAASPSLVSQMSRYNQLTGLRAVRPIAKGQDKAGGVIGVSQRAFSTSVQSKDVSATVSKDHKPSVEANEASLPKDVEQKLTFRQLVSQYGSFIVVSYTGVWILTGLTCFVGVNMIGPEAVMNGLTSAGVGNYVDLTKIDPRVGNFAVAMVVNELLEPVRLPLYLSGIRPLCRRYDAWRLKRNPAGTTAEAPKKNSLSQLMATYGPFGFVFYTSAWAATGVATYLTLSAVGPEAAIDGLKAVGIERFVDISHLDPKVSTLAVSVLINELLEPIRLPVVLATLVPAHKAYQNFKARRQ